MARDWEEESCQEKKIMSLDFYTSSRENCQNPNLPIHDKLFFTNFLVYLLHVRQYDVSHISVPKEPITTEATHQPPPLIFSTSYFHAFLSFKTHSPLFYFFFTQFFPIFFFLQFPFNLHPSFVKVLTSFFTCIVAWVD